MNVDENIDIRIFFLIGLHGLYRSAVGSGELWRLMVGGVVNHREAIFLQLGFQLLAHADDVLIGIIRPGGAVAL